MMNLDLTLRRTHRSGDRINAINKTELENFEQEIRGGSVEQVLDRFQEIEKQALEDGFDDDELARFTGLVGDLHDRLQSRLDADVKGNESSG